MFFFSEKKTLVQHGVFSGLSDHHSHILPGVDDGVKSMADSLAILSDFEEMGIKEVFLTPHIQEYIPNTTKGLQTVFEDLCKEYKGPITLHLAAEYMLDNLFVERFQNADLLFLLPESRYLLVETSYFNPPLSFYETLEDIKSKGITPVLAHPERYMYMNLSDYRKLKDMKVLFQLNISSLIGSYGKAVTEKALMLLNSDMYDFSGTDIHSRSIIQAFRNQKVKKIPPLPTE